MSTEAASPLDGPLIHDGFRPGADPACGLPFRRRDCRCPACRVIPGPGQPDSSMQSAPRPTSLPQPASADAVSAQNPHWHTQPKPAGAVTPSANAGARRAPPRVSPFVETRLRTAVASRAVTKPARQWSVAPAGSRLPPARHGVPSCAPTGRPAGSKPRRRPPRPETGRGGSTRISWLNQNDFGTSCPTGVRRNDAGGRFQPKCSISSPLAARKTAPVSGQTDITASTGIHISSLAPWSPVA